MENGTLPLLYARKGNTSRDLISGTCGSIEVSEIREIMKTTGLSVFTTSCNHYLTTFTCSI